MSDSPTSEQWRSDPKWSETLDLLGNKHNITIRPHTNLLAQRTGNVVIAYEDLLRLLGEK